MNGPLQPERTDPHLTYTTELELTATHEPDAEFLREYVFLNEQGQGFWEFEEQAVNAVETEGLSAEDRQVLKLRDDSSARCGSHYVLPIPFKSRIKDMSGSWRVAQR